MVHIIDQLKADHRNLEKVLAVLEHEIELLETESTNEEDSPDIPLIVDILDYIHTYPEQFHHPLEEATFDHMLENNIGDKTQIDAIRTEHRELSENSNKVRHMVEAIEMGMPMSMKKLHSALNGFAQMQREHIRNEEDTVFRDMEQISDSTSEQIRSQVEHLHDPVFTEHTKEQYNALLERLEAI